MDIQTAVDNFVAGLGHCQNLVAVHRAAGNGGPGRRGPETSVNRGIIVMAVATWQAFVQDLALALRDAAHTELQSVAGTPLLAAAVDQWDTDFNRALATRTERARVCQQRSTATEGADQVRERPLQPT